MPERDVLPGPRKWIEADAYIFDIDGTLLNAYGGAHYNAFHSALEKHFGLKCKIDGVPLHGNTDTGILRAVLAREGLADAHFDAKRSDVFQHMCDEVERNRDQVRSELCPGINALLEYLYSQEKLLGVATGNLERIGRIKMDAAGVSRYFSFGVFSDHHESREDIFRDALAQVTSSLGPAARTCFVGDTPRDIEAAQVVGAPIIAVATGIYGVADLAKYQPDLCLASCDELVSEAN
jgi:phosphoglycolate phosphatase-like HAD superfamily hydrolase